MTEAGREVLALAPISTEPQVGLLRAALHHLIQHEAEHRAHIAFVRDAHANR